MILTLTPNPTIDRVVFVRNFELGTVVRAEREIVTPSGKGVDASLVIHELGGDTVALGLKAGLNGRLHEGLLDEWGVAHEFVPAGGQTRMAVVLVDLAVGRQSTISAATLWATEDHLHRLLELVDIYAGRAWGLICAGSLPAGLPVDSYAHLLRHARRRGLVVLLDTSDEALCQGVMGMPHILKINREELVCLGVEVDVTPADDWRGTVDALACALVARLGQWASEAMVVTLGGHGALAVTREGCYDCRPPDVPVVNTAGAGDALNGSLMLALSRGADWPAALAAGTAAACSVIMNEGTAVCRREQVEQCLAQVDVRRLDMA
jgi:6-phosphofructokinase 2